MTNKSFNRYLKCHITFAAKKRWGVRSSISVPRYKFTKLLKTNLSNYLPQWILAAVELNPTIVG